jgi:rod shape-determining protein MreC
MHDKYLRRRRAALGVVVLAVLVVLTAVFGEADNSPLHSIQQGIVAVFRPIGHGVSTVVSPVRDLNGWVTSTFHAKSQDAKLKKSNARLQTELAQEGTALEARAQLLAIQKLNVSNGLNLTQYAPQYANVVGYNPELPYETIGLDEGSANGIRPGDPVITEGGLVGDIASVTAHTSVVAELSSSGQGVYAKIISAGSGASSAGTLKPVPGHLRTLQLNFVSAGADVANGDAIVTASYSDPSNPVIRSKYPAGIPIGVVSDFDYSQLLNDGTVDLRPAVDFYNISEVEVLTKVHR